MKIVLIKSYQLNLYKNIQERKSIYDSKYRIENELKIKEKEKKYRKEKNNDQIKFKQNTIIICECGDNYTKSNQSRHFKSKNHKEDRSKPKICSNPLE